MFPLDRAEWDVDGGTGNQIEIRERAQKSGDGHLVAIVEHDTVRARTTEAEARAFSTLIIAAPDLLRACRYVLKQIQSGDAIDDWLIKITLAKATGCLSADEVVDRAAIAKATGAHS